MTSAFLFAQRVAPTPDVAPPLVHQVLRSPGRPMGDTSGRRRRCNLATTSATCGCTPVRTPPSPLGRWVRGPIRSEGTLSSADTHRNHQLGVLFSCMSWLTSFSKTPAGQREAFRRNSGWRLRRPGRKGSCSCGASANWGIGASPRPTTAGSTAHVGPVVQRKCDAELGDPAPACEPARGVAGWQLLFKVGCDELLPGEAKKVDRLKVGSGLAIHGFASRDGSATFNDALSCHRANRIAELVSVRRADCSVVGTFRHGGSPTATPGIVRDVNPPEFWRSVVIEEIPPKPGSGEPWLDPARTISEGWALHARAQRDPTQANLDMMANRRSAIKSWLEGTPRTLAPEGAELTQRRLSDYRRLYGSAERLWTRIDELLILQRHSAAASDTHQAWAAGTGGGDQGAEFTPAEFRRALGITSTFSAKATFPGR